MKIKLSIIAGFVWLGCYLPSHATITVNAGPNQTLTLVAASTQTIVAGSFVNTSTVTVSTVTWSQLSPASPTALIVNPSSTTPTVVFNSSGTYIFLMSVADGITTSSDTVSITVNQAVVNQPPMVSAGSNQNTNNLSFTLTGIATDVDGLQTALTLNWRLVTGPAAVTISSPTQAQTGVSVPQAGTYVFEFSAYDGEHTSSDTVTYVVATQPLARDNIILRGSKNVVENGHPALIRFRLANAGTTTMTIFGSGGREVTRLIDHEYLTAGDYERSWDGGGNGSGTYKVRLEQDDHILKEFYIVVAF